MASLRPRIRFSCSRGSRLVLQAKGKCFKPSRTGKARLQAGRRCRTISAGFSRRGRLGLSFGGDFLFHHFSRGVM